MANIFSQLKNILLGKSSSKEQSQQPIVSPISEPVKYKSSDNTPFKKEEKNSLEQVISSISDEEYQSIINNGKKLYYAATGQNEKAIAAQTKQSKTINKNA